LVLDSPSPEIIRSLLPLVKNRPVIVNSVTITERFDELMPIIEREGAAVIALPVDEDGSGQTIESRRNKIDVLVKKFAERDFPHERIFIDIIAETLAANNQSALLALDSIAYINSAYPQIKSVCGLSNISFGLPKRININGAFLTAAVLSGLSAAIMDNTAPAMELYLKTALLIGGKDKNCLKYIKLIRALEKQNI
jgi:5-methyltetrahydrofolate--homocysteine methyltransferase